MADFLQVSTTTQTRDDAQRIADALVGRKLTACVQVLGPIASTYRWKDNVERAGEWLCLIKTSAARYAEVEAAVRELHPYEVPEIVATSIVAGSTDYLDWMEENTRP
jgi:periplasmic divalent cation tolerance protein